VYSFVKYCIDFEKKCCKDVLNKIYTVFEVL